MKTLAILMLFLLFNNIVYTQDMTCNPPAISVGGVCTRQSLAFTNIYEDFYNSDLAFWIPDNSTPVKTVKINFIIVQKSDGSGNFSHTGTGCFGISHETFLIDVINEVNNLFSNLDDPSDNAGSAICGACNQTKDTRIRFAVQGFHYFQNTAEWGVESTNYSYNPSSEVNIYIPATNLNYSFVNNLPNYSFSTAIYLMYNRLWIDYNFDCNIARHNAIQTLTHELGHVLGLNHTHLTGIGSCQNMYNGGNYFDDVFGTYPGNCPDLGNWQSDPLASATDGITNNIMGNTLGRGYLSTKQIAVINRNLSLKTCRNFLENCPSSNTDYTINSNEIWDFDFLIDKNLLVDNNSTLTIDCKLSMPQSSSITVESGGVLNIDGIVTNNCENGWNGTIHVKPGGILNLKANADITFKGNGKILIDEYVMLNLLLYWI